MSPLLIICGAFIFPLINSQQVDLSLFPKIVGGQDVVNLDNFSYQVSIQELGSHVCGGTIINQNHVLTAAHCCTNKDGKTLPATVYSIVSGTLALDNKTLFRHPVSRIYVHEHYNNTIPLENDIAIIRILGSFPNHTRPLMLADSEIPTGTNCIVSGWGDDRSYNDLSNALQYVIVPIRTTKICKYFFGNLITSTMLCAGVPGKDSCQGDSGGPMVCNGRLAGIVSWGIDCAIFPGIYTKVYIYRQWISTHIKSNISRSIGFKSNPTTSHAMLILGILLILRSYFERDLLIII